MNRRYGMHTLVMRGDMALVLREAEQAAQRVMDEVAVIETRAGRRSTHHLGIAVQALRTARLVLEADSEG